MGVKSGSGPVSSGCQMYGTMLSHQKLELPSPRRHLDFYRYLTKRSFYVYGYFKTHVKILRVLGRFKVNTRRMDLVDCIDLYVNFSSRGLLKVTTQV